MFVQNLESRRLLAADVWDGLLMVDGGPLADRISVSPDPAGIAVTEGSLRRVFPASIVDRIRVRGYGGNDTIRVSVTRPTTIEGGPGNDVLSGTAASDVIRGGDGNDTVMANGSNDTVFGEAGDDLLIGGDGADQLWGGLDNDQLVGAFGNDLLFGEDGDDVLFGGLDLPFTSYSLPAGHTDVDYMVGGTGNDTLRGGHSIDFLFGHDGNDALHGEAGDDDLYGNDGNDSLFGAAGDDLLDGGNGNDTLMAIGGGQRDSLRGSLGLDHYWLDAESTERILDGDGWDHHAWDVPGGGNVHRVASYYKLRIGGTNYGSPSREAWAADLPDPVAVDGAWYGSFSDRPLFPSGGPSKDDIRQGGVGDCYFLATLSATARTNPDLIRQRIADVGDGTCVVQFRRNGREHHVRVDLDLPVRFGLLAYARLGTEGSTWVAAMEKAWAFFRRNAGTYESISGGHPADVFTRLGVTSNNYSPSSAATLGTRVRDLLAAGQALTLSTKEGADLLVGNHVYMVDRVVLGAGGSVTHLVLRNPWGWDGDEGPDDSDRYDGYVTISVQDAARAYSRVTAGNV